MAYLIDTDIFIAAKNLHYGMDFCPAFWDWLVEANRSAKLLSIEAVHDDVADGGDELAEWAKARNEAFFVPPVESDLPALGQVTQWIGEHKAGHFRMHHTWVTAGFLPKKAGDDGVS